MLVGPKTGIDVEPLSFPADRDLRLQNLARADEGFLLALGYSSQRGYGRNHPFAGEIRLGEVEVEFLADLHVLKRTLHFSRRCSCYQTAIYLRDVVAGLQARCGSG